MQASLASLPEIFSFPETQLPYNFVSSSDLLMFGSERTRVSSFIRYRNQILHNLNTLGFCRKNYPYQIAKMRSNIFEVPLVEKLPRTFLMRDAFAQYQNAIDKICPAPIWLEKTPRNIFCLEFIEKYIPDAKFIHIVRAGEDTVASLVDAGRNHSAFHSRFGGEDGIERAVAYWNLSISQTLDVRGRGNHLVVALEKFIKNPEIQSRKMCAFVGASYADSMLNPRLDKVVTQKEGWKLEHGNKIRSLTSKFSTLFEPREQEFIKNGVILTRKKVNDLAD